MRARGLGLLADALADPVSVKFPCPYCGRPCEAGTDLADAPAVVHAMPPCRKYLAAPTVEILRAAADAAASARGVGIA